MSTHTIYGCVKPDGTIEFSDSMEGCDQATITGCLVQKGDTDWPAHAGEIRITHDYAGCETQYYACHDKATGKFKCEIDDGCCINECLEHQYQEKSPCIGNLITRYMKLTFEDMITCPLGPSCGPDCGNRNGEYVLANMPTDAGYGGLFCNGLCWLRASTNEKIWLSFREVDDIYYIQIKFWCGYYASGFEVCFSYVDDSQTPQSDFCACSGGPYENQLPSCSTVYSGSEGNVKWEPCDQFGNPCSGCDMEEA